MYQSQKMFPCRVLPDTACRSQLKAHSVSVTAAVFTTIALSSFAPFAGGPILCGFAIVLAWWSFRPNGPNRIINFIREFDFQSGYESPRDAVICPGPAWLASGVALIISAGMIPVARSVIVYALCMLWIVSATRQGRNKWTRLVVDLWNALFVFLSYPDKRFVAPGGTAAVWFPHSTMLRRRLYLGNILFPFYLAIGAGILIEFAATKTSIGDAIIDAVPLIPAPCLILFVLHLRSFSVLRDRSVSVDPDYDQSWEQAVSRVRSSTLIIDGVPLAEHLVFGFIVPKCEQAWHPQRILNRWDLPCRTPALIHQSAPEGHIHWTGPTGSSKTSVGIANTALQVIRGHNILQSDASGQVILGLDGDPLWTTSERLPLLFIDMKGDIAFKNTIEEECERRGQTFRCFTLEAGKASSYFNPLSNLQHQQRPVIELCEIVLNALDLFHGHFSYGPGYFAEQSRNLLLKKLKSANTIPRSWEELYELLTDTLDRKEFKDVFELLGRIFALAQYPLLGAAPEGVSEIHMPSVFENNEAIYFWLPALASAMSVIAVAKLAIFTFFDAARAWNTSGKPIKKSWLFWDESHVAVGPNMERVYQQATGAKICLATSSQSKANLDTRETPNLSRTVWTNTRVKQAFGIVDSQEAKDWIDLSGEELGHIRSYNSGIDGQGNRTSSCTVQEVVHSRLNHEIINDVNNTPAGSLLHLTTDIGLTRNGAVPVQIICPFPISLADYRRRSTTSWPDAPEIQINNTVTQTTVVNTRSPADIDRTAADNYAALENLFASVSSRSMRRRQYAVGEQ